MSVQLIAFVFGCLLLLVGIVGGGFQIKELTVPKVGRLPRLTLCVFSLLFLLVGVRPDFAGSTERKREAQPAAASDKTKKKVPWEQKPRQWWNRFKEARG